MAALSGCRSGKTLLKLAVSSSSNRGTATATQSYSRNKKILLGAAAAVATGVAGIVSASTLKADGLDLTPPHFHWSHRGFFDAFDHASLRRGYQVYKQVCAACHSMQYVHYRDLVGVIMTEEEAKKEAAEAMIEDGPDAEGEMFQRPGKLTDVLPPPYKNQQAAMAANNGAYPPDLSVLTMARHHEEDYIFALLTGYCDPPPGMEEQEGLHYNPYFTGSWIGMAEALYNDIIEYEDGTPASQSQLAKDVATFLRWTAEPDFDDRKLLMLKVMPVIAFGWLMAVYVRRVKMLPPRTTVTQILKDRKVTNPNDKPWKYS